MGVCAKSVLGLALPAYRTWKSGKSNFRPGIIWLRWCCRRSYWTPALRLAPPALHLAPPALIWTSRRATLLQHCFCCRRTHRGLLRRCLTLQLLQTRCTHLPTTFPKLPKSYQPFQTLLKQFSKNISNYLPFRKFANNFSKATPQPLAMNYFPPLTLLPRALPAPAMLLDAASWPLLPSCNAP